MGIHTQRTCVYTGFIQCITEKVRLIACHFRTQRVHLERRNNIVSVVDDSKWLKVRVSYEPLGETNGSIEHQMARQFEFYLNTREFPRALSPTHLAHRPRNRNSCLFEATWKISSVNRRSRTLWIFVALFVECEVTKSQGIVPVIKRVLACPLLRHSLPL